MKHNTKETEVGNTSVKYFFITNKCTSLKIDQICIKRKMALPGNKIQYMSIKL